jgi:hypothetical protein
MPPSEILATTSSRLNSKALAACVVLAHPRVTFHPCTCELHKGVAAVTAALFGYDDVKAAAKTTTRRMLADRHATMLDRCSNSSSVA